MFERFTERAREVVILAQDEARLLKHGSVGEEHLLLGLLREEDGLAARALRQSGVELDDMRERVRAAVGEGAEPATGQIPFTPAAKRALERALRESLSLGHNVIGTEDVLLGVLRDPGAVAAQVLDEAGVDIEALAGRATRSPAGMARLEVLPGTSESRFTERARRAVVLAQEEARALTHNYVGTEHLLLGLLCEEEGLAARVLGTLNITIEGMRAQIARIVGVGDEVATGELPFTPRAKNALERGMREALSLGHNQVGTEHILLGLASENEGVAARILLAYDADEHRIRDEVMRALAGPAPTWSPPPEPPMILVPCPACGAKLSHLEIAADRSGAFRAQRKGRTTCSGCGSTYELRYRIEWRPAG